MASRWNRSNSQPSKATNAMAAAVSGPTPSTVTPERSVALGEVSP
jgi:hypothetical protein